ncbi:MAG: L,D-transpeptidase [Chloroflexota bacterium]
MSITRRDFLKVLGGTAMLSVIRPLNKYQSIVNYDFPVSDHLGRVIETMNYRTEPRMDDYTKLNKQAYQDEIITINQEIVSANPDFNYPNMQRWFETPNGFLFSGYVQPVKNLSNQPIDKLQPNQSGFWAEVTIPIVDLILDNPPAKAPWLNDVLARSGTPRLYYSQVVWIDQVKTGDNGQLLYRFEENGGRPQGATGGSYGDIFWADGKAFRPLTEEDVSPIHPEVDPTTKKVIVDVTRGVNTLLCMEGDHEVYFCRCSPGAKFNSDGTQVDNWTTIPGEYKTQWKTVSIHMSGGSTGAGYDTPAVSWANFFDSQHGMAIHSAFWHNLFGEQVSHGCVNVTPEDAKWIFRWTSPKIDLSTADLRNIQDGTHVIIKERSF